jgi:hypothetical protein
MRYKLLIFAVACLVLYYRPLYSILMLLVLYVEYLNAIYMIFLIKTEKFYRKISIKQPDVSSMSNVDI